MRELPISFNNEMVRAIRENRKTQTRRLNGLIEINKHPNKYKVMPALYKNDLYRFLFYSDELRQGIFINKLYQIGDKLYIREIFSGVREWIEVVDVYPERLQLIDENDIIAEGIKPIKTKGSLNELVFREKFIELWDSIYAKRGYPFEGNFWVWVIKFKRIKK